MLIELPYNLTGKIFRSPMPFSQFDHTDVWSSYHQNEIGMVIVLTEQQEYLVYAGKDLPAFYQNQGLDVIHIPLPDFGIPDDLESWQAGLDAAVAAARRGKNIAVHCLAGVGRTGIFMACLAKEVLGLEGLEAIEWVRESLRGAMENWRQEEFVIGYQSGRSG